MNEMRNPAEHDPILAFQTLFLLTRLPGRTILSVSISVTIHNAMG